MAKKGNFSKAMGGSKDAAASRAAVYAVVLATLILFYLIVKASSLGIEMQAASAIFLLAVAGIYIQRSFSFSGGFGLYAASTKRGIGCIKRLARNRANLWEAMAEWGLVLGFGVLAYWLTGGKINKRVYAIGLASLVLMLLVVVPFLGMSIQFLNVPQISARLQVQQSSPLPSGASAAEYLIYAATTITGFTGYMIVALWYNGLLILASVVKVATTGSLVSLASQTPGVVPLIPGITIPLLAGVAALVILMVIHEFSHGVLARIAKVRIKAIGLLVYGIIPIGAFVEPEEKEISKLDRMRQTRIFSAGFSANFLATVFFFAALYLLIQYMPGHVYAQHVVITGTLKGFPAYGVIRNGSQILYWNGFKISNMSSFQYAAKNDSPGSLVNITTNLGTYSLIAKAPPDTAGYNQSKGLVGVEIGEVNQPVNNGLFTKFMIFLYALVGLSFLLNFAIAVLNLLPLPMFDGWRIYKANIKSNRFTNLMAALIVLGLLLNVLPWFAIL